MNFSSRWFRALFLMGSSGFLILFFYNKLWSNSVDVANNYALVARIAEYWRLPTTVDPSLGEMNFYPRYAHFLAAIFGFLLGSPLAGMQFVALLSLTCLWSAFAFMFSSLPHRTLSLVSAALALIFLANFLFIHSEIFGNEIVGNFSFAQLVAQTVALVLITFVLYMEKDRVPAGFCYLVLGCSVLFVEQIHLLPALEILVMLMLLVMANFFSGTNGGRWITLSLGLFINFASLTLTVLSPAFTSMRTISENNGDLILIYTPNANTLAIESAIVVALSVFLFIGWTQLDRKEGRINGLILKYLSLLGMAIAGLCFLQILALRFGFGSLYAIKKYAFGLNTVLALDVPLLLVMRSLAPASWNESSNSHTTMFRNAFPALFVFIAVFTTLPVQASIPISLGDVIRAERFTMQHRDPSIGSDAGMYDYGIGLFGGYHALDYLISIGVLKAPRKTNAYDILYGNLPSRPRKVARIFTREGSKPWDIPECRQYLTNDGFAILDGSCVLNKLEPAHP